MLLSLYSVLEGTLRRGLGPLPTTHYPLTDDEWAARANMMERPAPITRTNAPEAHVVIVTGPVPAIDEGQEALADERQEEPCL